MLGAYATVTAAVQLKRYDNYTEHNPLHEQDTVQNYFASQSGVDLGLGFLAYPLIAIAALKAGRSALERIGGVPLPRPVQKVAVATASRARDRLGSVAERAGTRWNRARAWYERLGGEEPVKNPSGVHRISDLSQAATPASIQANNTYFLDKQENVVEVSAPEVSSTGTPGNYKVSLTDPQFQGGQPMPGRSDGRKPKEKSVSEANQKGKSNSPAGTRPHASP